MEDSLLDSMMEMALSGGNEFEDPSDDSDWDYDYEDDSFFAQYDDDPSPYDGDNSEL